MKKFIAMEIEIPNQIMKAETEDQYIRQLVTRLKSVHQHFVFELPEPHPNFDSRAVSDTFTGKWEFIDSIG